MITSLFKYVNKIEVAVFALAIVNTSLAKADEYITGNSSYACPKIDIFKSLMTDIPYSAALPINIGGSAFGKGSRIPEGASDKSVCSCTDSLGFTNYGLAMGLWEVAYLIELTREPNCAPILGISLPFGETNIGSAGSGVYDSSDLSFYHAHVYSFPLFTMLNLFSDLNCGKTEYMDLDLLYASELDPLWQNETLGISLTPEIQALGNEAIVASCSADALAAYKGEIIEDLFYCVGAWGFLYPLAGYIPALGSVAENTSLIAVRALALMHRRGLLRKTYGDEALCGASTLTEFNKGMYRLSLLYPIAEREDNHSIGAPVEFWEGDARVPPGTHDVIYVVWRYRNCCLGAFEG